MALNVELLFNAFVTRFNAHANLLATGRKLSMVEESTKPWTEFEVVGFSTEDTFSDDIEIRTIRLTFHGKWPTPTKAANWLAYVTDAFDDYWGLSVSGYTTTGMNRAPNDAGPTLVDGVFEASAEWEVWLTRSALLPATRGA